MKKKKTNSTSKYIKARQRKKIWRNTVSCLVALVLFCTSYMLVRPAATMNKDCGQVEHIHEDGCYDENGDVICPFLEHVHTEECTSSSEENQTAIVENYDQEIMIDTADEEILTNTDDLTSNESMNDEQEHSGYSLDSSDQSEEDIQSVQETPEDSENNNEEGDYLFEGFPFTKNEILDVSNGPKVLVNVEWEDDVLEDSDVETAEINEIVKPRRSPKISADAQETMNEPIQDEIDSFAEEAPKNIEEYLKEIPGSKFQITLTDREDHPIKPGDDGNIHVDGGTIYKLAMYIASPKGIAKGKYTYQLPEGIAFQEADGVLATKSGVVIGQWKLDKDGLITFDFNDNANSATGFEMSISMEIRFENVDQPIELPGGVKIEVNPPEEVREDTRLDKLSWKKDGKVYWRVEVEGGKESEIPGTVISDKHLTPNHYITPEDRANMQLAVEVRDPKTGKITTHHLLDYLSDTVDGEGNVVESNIAFYNEKGEKIDGNPFDENGKILPATKENSAVRWEYKVPKQLWCTTHDQMLELGSANWTYKIQYTSTPYDPNAQANNQAIEVKNEVSYGDKKDEAKETFTWKMGVEPQITKTGEYVSALPDQPETDKGQFNWKIHTYIPPKQLGQKAVLNWHIQDIFGIYDKADGTGVLQNLPDWLQKQKVADWLLENYKTNMEVTFSNDPEMKDAIIIPNIRDATESDQFVWDIVGVSTENNNTTTNVYLSILSKCECNESNCQVWNVLTKDSCQHYLNALQSQYCYCWNYEKDAHIEINYRVPAENFMLDFSGKDFQYGNLAVVGHGQLMLNDKGKWVVTDTQDDQGSAIVPIPGLFYKEEIEDTDKYTAKYRITINEGKTELVKPSEKITITDDMSETLGLQLQSIVIKAEDKDGHVRELERGKDYTVEYDPNVMVNGTKKHRLSIVITVAGPEKYTIDYKAVILKPTTGGNIVYDNSAVIEIWGRDIISDVVEKVVTDYVSTAEMNKVSIKKVDSKTLEPLSDAQFGVFDMDDSPVAVGTTDSNGLVTFKTDIAHGVYLLSHSPYYIKELKITLKN